MKYDDINTATDGLVNQDTLYQFAFYHRLCLALSDRFTRQELEPIIADCLARTNARIKESEAPCASS